MPFCIMLGDHLKFLSCQNLESRQNFIAFDQWSYSVQESSQNVRSRHVFESISASVPTKASLCMKYANCPKEGN